MTLLELFSSFEHYDTAVTKYGEILFKSSSPFDVDNSLDIAIPDNYTRILDVDSAAVFADEEQMAILVTLFGSPVLMGLMYQTHAMYHQKVESLMAEFANEEQHG